MWKCKSCQHLNQDYFSFCEKCGCREKVSLTIYEKIKNILSTPKSVQNKSWSCRYCGYDNDVLSHKCHNCGKTNHIEISQKRKQQILNSNMEEPIIRCPYCGSRQLSVGEKGFSTGKAVVGTLLTNMVGGILFGFLGSGKAKVTCLKCGKNMNVSELEKIYPNSTDKDGFPPII